MSKPTIDDTRFGETGGGTPAGTLSNPPSGTKDTGYVAGNIPPAGQHSWLWNKAHAWFKYINGLIDGSENWTFPAGVSVAGNVTLQGIADAFSTITPISPDNPTSSFGVSALITVKTGTGPIRIASTGTVPTGLSSSTDYWVILVRASATAGSTFKLASSLGNALDGTAVTFSSNGSGTISLTSSGSTADVRLATTSTKVEISTLAVVADLTSANDHFTVPKSYPVPITDCFDGTTGSITAGVLTLGAAGKVIIPVRAPIGARVFSLDYGIAGNSVATLNVALVRTTELGVQSSTSFGGSTPGAGLHATSAVSSVGVTTQSDSVYAFELSPTAIGLQITAPRVVADRP